MGVLAVGVAALLAASAHAAFQDLDTGARPVGMGGAFSAIADDSNAPLYNPAGIVQVQWNELSASYANLFSGLDLHAGNDTSQLNQGYLAFTARPIPHVGSFELSWSNFDATHLYREDSVALTYARNMGDFFPILDNALALGVNLKYLRRSVTEDSFTADPITPDPVFAGGDSKSAGTVDAGLLYHPNDGPLSGVRFALVGMNLTQPDVGFGEVDRVPLETRLGIAYQSPALPWLVPDVDITRQDGETTVAGGLESWLFHNTLGLRAGANNDEGSMGVSYFQMIGKRFGLRLDYAYTVPYFIDDTGGSHRLALTLYF